jgi:hypothetical protein
MLSVATKGKGGSILLLSLVKLREGGVYFLTVEMACKK